MSNTDPEFIDLLGDVGDILPSTAEAETPPALAAVAGGASVAYDASDRVAKLGAWNAPIRSADRDLLPEKKTLDARARDTGRNDAYVAGSAQVHKDSIVGALYTLTAKPSSTVLFGKEDAVWEAEFQEEVETKFHLWAESPQHWLDAQRRNTLTEWVRLGVGVWCAGGEVLASAEWMKRDGRPFRSAVQMIDTDRLSNPMVQNLKEDIRGGVERDYFGAAVAYHIRKNHPADVRGRWDFNYTQEWRRIPARTKWGRQMILHVFEQLRPQQTRGISQMVTALTEMRMTKRFRQTELERAIIAASYAASIETEMPAGEVYTAMGANDTDNATVDWAESYLSAVAEYSGGAKNLTINGSRIPVFFPGTHLKIQNPGAASPAGDKFEASLLRYIAAATGLSYEQLSRDYTNTSYSSARASMAETWRAMNVKKRMVADAMANFVYRLWLEEVINYNQLECLKRQNVPAFYEGLNAEAYSGAEWLGAGQGMIDPLKETQADVLAVKNGLMTKEAAIAKRSGSDWRRVARQRKREQELDHDLDLPSIHDGESSDMENALSGTPQERES